MADVNGECMNLKNLTDKELLELLNDVQAETNRRTRLGQARVEIQKVLKKYDVDSSELSFDSSKSVEIGTNKKRKAKKPINSASRDTQKSARNINGKSASARPDSRSNVKSKYKNPNGTEKWSGRGRAPKWVLDICKSEGISLESFKTNSTFAA